MKEILGAYILITGARWVLNMQLICLSEVKTFLMETRRLIFEQTFTNNQEKKDNKLKLVKR